MKESIKNLKQDLKSLAKQIKEKKSLRKTVPNGYVAGLSELQMLFRHKHVAYCLVRGRKLEQIDSGYRLNMDWVNWIIASMQPDSKEKLYVVVNEKLSPSQQAVQAAHCAAEFVRKNPHTQWRNGHLILLKDNPGWSGNMLPALYCLPHEGAQFVEPDVGNKVTAYAAFGYDIERHMKKKVLL